MPQREKLDYLLHICERKCKVYAEAASLYGIDDSRALALRREWDAAEQQYTACLASLKAALAF